MNLGALIFDVDGTLAETEEAHRVAFNEAFAEAGLAWVWSARDYRVLLGTTGGKERIAAFQDALPKDAVRLDAAAIAELHRDKTRRYARILATRGLRLRPGVAELIAAARRRRLRLAVATTTSHPNVEMLCQCCWGRPAREVFDVVAAGEDVRVKKPAPDVYLLALGRLGLPPEACLAFEDSANGVRAARAAGLRVVLTPSAFTEGDDFPAADWSRRDLTGVASLVDALRHGLDPS